MKPSIMISHGSEQDVAKLHAVYILRQFTVKCITFSFLLHECQSFLDIKDQSFFCFIWYIYNQVLVSEQKFKNT